MLAHFYTPVLSHLQEKESERLNCCMSITLFKNIHEFFIFAKFPHFLTKSSEMHVEIGDAESEEIVRK